MLKKAIAAHTIFIVGAITIFILFVTATFFGYIDWSGKNASQFACQSKLLSYCSELQKGRTPWNWDNKDPKGCENPPININQPSADDCKKLFPSLGST